MDARRLSLPPIPFEDQSISPICSQDSLLSRRSENDLTDEEYDELLDDASESLSNNENEGKEAASPSPPVQVSSSCLELYKLDAKVTSIFIYSKHWLESHILIIPYVFFF